VIHGAGTFLFDADGRLLLIKEDYGQRRYSLPGGQVEEGESPIDAAVREAREEIGCEIRVTGVVGVALFRWTDLSVTAFVGEIVSGEPHAAAVGEIAEVDWFDVRALPTPQANTVRLFAHAAARGERGLVIVEDESP
jgi:8-oxo-dGTP diphosphatase